MDFRHLEYFVEIAKEKSITKAAEKLFVSQSAVNQHLLKLENELGTQLFIRNRRSLELTQAGKIYLRGCERALLIRKDTLNEIHDLVEARSGLLTIGLAHGRGLTMFTSIYPKMKTLFPHLKITPVEMSAFNQQTALAMGEIDLGFLIIPRTMTDSLHYVDLAREEILLLVPANHPLCAGYPRTGGENMPIVGIDVVRDIPFALTREGSSFRKVCDRIFHHAGFEPEILLETSNTSHVAQITEIGECCGLLPYYYANFDDPRYRCFRLEGQPTWQLYIACREDASLTQAAKQFIELSREYWAEHTLMAGAGK